MTLLMNAPKIRRRMPSLILAIKFVAIAEGLLLALIVGAAASAIIQKIRRRFDGRPLRLAGTVTRIILVIAFAAGVTLGSFLAHRAYAALEILLECGDFAEAMLALCAPPALIAVLAVAAYFIFAPEAVCRPLPRKYRRVVDPCYLEDIIPVPLALATGCIPFKELDDGSVICLVNSCPDRPVDAMLRRRLGVKIRYVRAAGKLAEVAARFFKTRGANCRPAVFDSPDFLDDADAVSKIESGVQPCAEVSEAKIPADSLLLVAVSVFFRSERVHGLEPKPAFGYDRGVSYAPYDGAAISSDGGFVLIENRFGAAPPEIPNLLIFEQRLLDGDAHAYSLRLFDPKDWIAFAPPSDYRVAGLDAGGNLVIEIAGKPRTISAGGGPTEFFSEAYYVLSLGGIYRRRLRISIRDFRVFPKSGVKLSEAFADSTALLHETVSLPPLSELI